MPIAHPKRPARDWSLPLSFNEPTVVTSNSNSERKNQSAELPEGNHSEVNNTIESRMPTRQMSYNAYVGPPLASHKLRLKILTWVWVIAAVGIAVRLIDIQLLRGNSYSRRAAGQQERQLTMEARRGKIVDHSGIELAVSLPAASVAINPRKIRGPLALSRKISAITHEPVDDIYRRINKNNRSFAWVARNIDLETAKRICALDTVATMMLPATRRRHPLGSLSGQLLGHVSIDNAGGDGIEALYNNVLAGRDGWKRTLVDAFGDQVPNTNTREQHAIDGGHISLTIDADYQAIVEHELSVAVEATGATGGRAILLDATTGAIRAMANVPTYDPDSYRSADPGLRRNRAITDPFEPGSTFKIVAASAVLAERLISPTDTIDCLNGSITIAGQTIRDTHANGRIPFKEVFSKSSNIGTIIAAQHLSKDDFYRYIRRFGFGAETGVGLPGESKGILAPTSRWSGRSHATLAIGQEIGVTTLQMASAYAALANNGWLMRPYVVQNVMNAHGSIVERTSPLRIRQVVPTTVANQMVDLLTNVVDEGTGTTARIAGLRVAGKTGTAQIAREDGRGYERGAYTASFVGFLPDMERRLVCAVSIDRPKKNYYGATAAGPVFRQIMSRILSRDAAAIASVETTNGISTPNLIGMAKAEVIELGNDLGIRITTSGTGSKVVGQWPPASARLSSDGSIEILLANQVTDVVSVPDVRNMSMREAMRILNSVGLEYEFSNTGVVYAQYPAPGSRIAGNSTMKLYCRAPALSSPRLR